MNKNKLRYEFKIEEILENGISGDLIGYFSRGHQRSDDFARAVNGRIKKIIFDDDVGYSYAVKVPYYDTEKQTWASYMVIDDKHEYTKQGFPITYIKI